MRKTMLVPVLLTAVPSLAHHAVNVANDRIEYQAIVTDPGTFTEPATLAGSWIWNPGEEIKPFQCATPDGGP